MTSRGVLLLAADSLERSRSWPADIEAAIAVIAATYEHERACTVCPGGRVDGDLIRNVLTALGAGRDESLAELAAAALELADELRLVDQRCAANDDPADRDVSV